MPKPGALTVHVLDTANGCPAVAVRVSLHRLSGDGAHSVRIAETATDAQGRCAEPLLSGSDFRPGRYRLDFAVADYFRGKGHTLPDPPFFDVVTISFGISDSRTHYHVPLLVSPFGYSTYRGS